MILLLRVLSFSSPLCLCTLAFLNDGLTVVTPDGCPLGLLGGRRSGLGNLRSGGTANTLKLGWAGLSAPPSQRVLQAWQEMTLFLQQFVENNLGKSWCLVYS